MWHLCCNLMKVVFKTRYPVPFLRMILILLLSLISGTYYLKISRQNEAVPISAAAMSVSSIVPDINLIDRSPQFVRRQLSIGRNQTFSELMESQGFDGITVNQVYETAKDVYNLARIQAGKTMTLTLTPDNKFERLEYIIDPIQTLAVSTSEEGMKAEMLQKSVETRLEDLGGYIHGSLYASIERLGEQDELVINFADIFEWDIDFFTELQEGDSFRIIYEKKYVDGAAYAYGNILAAELTNKNKVYTAIGYQRNGKNEFFSPDGKAMKKAFLASPLKFSRISAGFSHSRFHPILKKRRPHYGIDYAAPTGTPVRSIGNGKVILAGWAGGGGKTIKIQHDREIATVYCHLSKFARGIKNGAGVSQGQVIGYVGSTGLATGPHLDFRFLKNGRYVNFLSIKSPQAAPLSAAEIASFQTASSNIIRQLSDVTLREAKEDMMASASPVTAIY